LYGVLDGTTLEWTDGIFTSLLRTIIANQRGEADKRHWIVFDGDVDPEWAENLNRLVNLPNNECSSMMR
jgi:dynein heavy chain 1